MVSKASEDFPEPLRPVITVKVLRGISTEMFFRLCWRAPLTVIFLMDMGLINLGKRAGTAASPKSFTPQSGPERSARSSTPYLNGAEPDGQFRNREKPPCFGLNNLPVRSENRPRPRGSNTAGNHEI